MEKLKELREKTGAGISDCKKALEEAGGDIEKAIEILRKQGIAKAAKRTEREATEGIIKVVVDKTSKEGYIVELNAETDFVVRNEKFQEFANFILELVKEKKPADREKLLALTAGEGTVKESLESLSGVIGEKLDIAQVGILTSTGIVAAYSHLGGKIGVLVGLDKGDETELARNIAMQVAAANPRYIKIEDVPQDEVDKEKEIYKEQLEKEGKPKEIIDKIIEGKLKKYFEEICLLEQEYIKDDKQRVKELLGETKIESFIRYSLDN